jgi:hypothetical protein
MPTPGPAYRTKGGATVTTIIGTPGLYDSSWRCGGCNDSWDSGPEHTIKDLAQGHAKQCTAIGSQP